MCVFEVALPDIDTIIIKLELVLATDIQRRIALRRCDTQLEKYSITMTFANDSPNQF